MAGQPSPLLKTSFPQRVSAAPSQSARTKKKLIRRTDRDFLHSNYGLVAGVKMLNFFRFLGETGLIVIGILVLASVFVQNFLVLLSLYLRRFTGICFLIEPRAHSPRARALH